MPLCVNPTYRNEYFVGARQRRTSPRFDDHRLGRCLARAGYVFYKYKPNLSQVQKSPGWVEYFNFGKEEGNWHRGIVGATASLEAAAIGVDGESPYHQRARQRPKRWW